MWLLLRRVLLVAILFHGFFSNAEENKVSKKLELSKNSSLDKKIDDTKFKIEMTKESLENAWNIREKAENQKIIINFLKSEPNVPADFEISWRIARLVYFAGNFGIGEKMEDLNHVKLFEYGYLAGEIAKKLRPDRVEGFYWYGVDLGSYGLAKGILSALSNAKPGRDALLQAASIDPKYQWGGAYRVLGRYYQEVPSFISFGDKVVAREYFNKAIGMASDYRLNKIYLGNLELDEGNHDAALKNFKEASEMKDVDGIEEEIHFKRNLAISIKKANN